MANLIPAERVATRYPLNPYPDRDALTKDDNNGVRFLFDLGFEFCYPGGPVDTRPALGDPSHGDSIYNTVRYGAGDGNGSVAIATPLGSTLTYAGGGFDLSNSKSGIANGPTGVVGPAAALADIWNAAPAGSALVGETQYFLWAGYFKLPTTANWAATGSIRTLFSASNSDTGYSGSADILNIAMKTGSPYKIDARRQTAAGTLEAITVLQPQAGDYGSVVQLAYWRNAGGSVFRLKSAAGTVMSAPTVYADNTQNFSAMVPCWGHPQPFYSNIEGYSGARVYRGFIENLARSGRNPQTVLDADWDEIVRRAAFN